MAPSRAAALLALFALFMPAAPSRAQSADELDALKLADQAGASPAAPAPTALGHIEAAAGRSARRYGLPARAENRVALELQGDRPLAPGWRGVFANRLDAFGQRDAMGRRSVNTLKELYLTWQPSAAQLLDLGRINAPQGVASGYNPTDFFRAGALRTALSAEPASLKKNRLGTVMLRGQALWSDGALTALLAPKLVSRPSDAAQGAPFSAALGATNGQTRWQIAWSQRISPSLTAQGLLQGEDQRAPQLGLNLSLLAGAATVLFLEGSGGRSRSQAAEALQSAQPQHFHARLAVGASYSAANKLVLTLELAHNGAAPDRAQWQALQQGPAGAYEMYRRWVQRAQELPTRDVLNATLSWRDALGPHRDLSALLRHNLNDHSRLHWLEARQHWTHTDLALQWQWHSGRPLSEFGALPERRVWQLSVRRYF